MPFRLSCFFQVRKDSYQYLWYGALERALPFSRCLWPGNVEILYFLREYSVSLKSMEKVMNCTLLTLSYVNLHNICLWPENHNILSFFKGIFSSLNLKQEGS